MDPRLLYTDFLMDDREVLLQPTTYTEPTFQDDRDYTFCAIAVFRLDDPSVSYLVMGPDIKLELCDCLSGPRLYYRQPLPREV